MKNKTWIILALFVIITSLLAMAQKKPYKGITFANMILLIQ